MRFSASPQRRNTHPSISPVRPLNLLRLLLDVLNAWRSLRLARRRLERARATGMLRVCRVYCGRQDRHHLGGGRRDGLVLARGRRDGICICSGEHFARDARLTGLTLPFLAVLAVSSTLPWPRLGRSPRLDVATLLCSFAVARTLAHPRIYRRRCAPRDLARRAVRGGRTRR